MISAPIVLVLSDLIFRFSPRLFFIIECQSSHWVLHKPDCFRAQGKAVSESVRVKADEARVEREAKVKAKDDKAAQAHSEMIRADIEAFTDEGPEQVNTFSHTCFGRRRRADLPLSAVDVEMVIGMTLDLEFETVLSLGMFPDGINHESCSGRGVLLKNPQWEPRLLCYMNVSLLTVEKVVLMVMLWTVFLSLTKLSEATTGLGGSRCRCLRIQLHKHVWRGLHCI